MFGIRRLSDGEAKSLRHWAMEFVVVVFGVLIALWLQQWADGRREKVALQATEDAIHREVVANLIFLIGRETISQCLRDRAHEIHDQLGQEGPWPGIRGSSIITDFAKSAPDTITGIYNVLGEEPAASAWQSALESGTLSAMDRERFDKLVAIYALIDRIRWSRADEQRAIGTLSSLANPIQLTPEIRNQMHQAVWQVEQTRWTLSQFTGPSDLARRMQELGWNDYAEVEKYRRQTQQDIQLSGVTLRPCVKPVANPFKQPKPS